MRLLLAEDEEAMAEAVTAFLEYHHYDIDWVNNGTDALETARTGIYDVLILDIMMPGMDGLTVLRTLRGGRKYHAGAAADSEGRGPGQGAGL